MVVAEVLDESGVHNVAGGNPAPLFDTVSLRVYQVLVTTTTSMNCQKLLHCTNWISIDEPGRQWGLKTRTRELSVSSLTWAT